MCSSIPGENGFNFGVQERCGKSIFVLSQYQVLAYLIPQIKQQPHTVEVYSLPSRQSGICLRCRCYCQSSSSHILLPSLIMKDNENNTFFGCCLAGRAARCPTMWGCRCCPSAEEECHPIYVSLVPKARCNSLPPLRIALM